jgi:hypothetical protein
MISLSISFILSPQKNNDKRQHKIQMLWSRILFNGIKSDSVKKLLIKLLFPETSTATRCSYAFCNIAADACHILLNYAMYS